MFKWIGRFAILLVVATLSATEVQAAGKKTPPKKDPVESAFALPSGLVLTPQEKEWAQGVRAQLEPRLRDALRRVEQASDTKEKGKAAAEVREIREQIQQAINQILQQRAIKAAQEYAKKVAAAKKKQAEARKKAAKRKKGRKKKGKKRR